MSGKRNGVMKKKLIIFIGICMLAAFPAASNSDFSIGVGVGTATFVTTRVNLDRNTAAVLNIGFGHWQTEGMYIRPQLQFYQSDRRFSIERQNFFPYLGVAVPLGLMSKLDLTLSGVLGLSYYINNGPVELYIEALPGLDLVRKGEVGMGLGFGASIGARYAF